jgi:hypothetical protein
MMVMHVFSGGGVDEWAAKVRRYTQLSEVQVKPNPKKAAQPEVAMAMEGQLTLKAISPQVPPPL